MNFTLITQSEHSWSWVYLHGAAARLADSHQTYGDENWCAPDLAGCDTKLCTYDMGERTHQGTPINGVTYHIEPGIHQCTVYGEDAVAYLWRACPGGHPIEEFSHLARIMGLVCLKSDQKSMADAHGKYMKKSSTI